LQTLPDRSASEYDSFAELVTRSPGAMLCLLSALRFHALTMQQSSDVWLAIPQKGQDTAVRLSTATGGRMSGPAKTVAGCFKFRNKIGPDVALEALHDT
jgi:hypothetical protein